MTERYTDNLIRRAMKAAIIAHAGQTRKGNGKPFVTHPIHVGWTLQDYYRDDVLTAVGYLHDVLEDTDYSEARMRTNFGHYITDRVVDLTKVPGKTWVLPTNLDSIRVKVADAYDNALDVLVARDRNPHEDPWAIFSKGKDKLEYWYDIRDYAVSQLPRRKEDAAIIAGLTYVLDTLKET